VKYWKAAHLTVKNNSSDTKQQALSLLKVALPVFVEVREKNLAFGADALWEGKAQTLLKQLEG
jgi:hypothetical protein